VIKSHAKYFSQQNSPVAKDGNTQVAFPSGKHNHQQSMGGNQGAFLASSGAGMIGIENNHNTHQTTGNFGSIPS